MTIYYKDEYLEYMALSEGQCGELTIGVVVGKGAAAVGLDKRQLFSQYCKRYDRCQRV